MSCSDQPWFVLLFISCGVVYVFIFDLYSDSGALCCVFMLCIHVYMCTCMPSVVDNFLCLSENEGKAIDNIAMYVG